MKCNLYSIKDSVSGLYQAPFSYQSEKVMLRAVGSAVNGPKGMLLSEYPEDCSVYKVGYFDDQTGSVEHIEPEFIVNCIDLKIHTIEKSEESEEDA